MNSKRFNRPIWLLLLIVLGIGTTDCASGTRLAPLAGNAVVLAFGDSLTYGTGAEPAESYPAFLEKLIGRKVVNAGIPGEISEEGLSRLPKVLDHEKPALLLLCHGANDLLRHLNPQQASDNIRAMIRLARERGVAVVLIAVPAPGLSLSPSPIYRQIARDSKLPLEESILATVLADASLKSDYIHPNAAGYRRMAEALANLLKKSGAIE
jgi:acyl-CoA thioesterase I